MATTDLVTKKINYTLEKKTALTEAVGLTGNPTWNQIIAKIENPISPVADISFSNSTISWVAPTFTNATGRNLSLEYLIYVNDTLVETTTNTSYDIKNAGAYLLIGNNNIKVLCRVSLNNTDATEEVLSVNISCSIASSGVNLSPFYSDGNDGCWGTYYVDTPTEKGYRIFNIKNQREISYLYIDLGQGYTFSGNLRSSNITTNGLQLKTTGVAYAQIDRYLYVFPQWNYDPLKVLKFDLGFDLSQTVQYYTELGSYPTAINDLLGLGGAKTAQAVNGYIYILGGNTTKILRYDPLNDSFIQNVIEMPETTGNYITSFEIDGTIYFAYWNDANNIGKIYKIEIDTTYNVVSNVSLFMDISEIAYNAYMFSFDKTSHEFFIQFKPNGGTLKMFRASSITGEYQEIQATGSIYIETYFFNKPNNPNVVIGFENGVCRDITKTATITQEE